MLFFIFLQSCYSLSGTYYGFDSIISFDKDTVAYHSIDMDSGEEYSFTLEFSMYKNNGFVYLTFNGETYLCFCFDDFIEIYNSNNRLFFFGAEASSQCLEHFTVPDKASVLCPTQKSQHDISDDVFYGINSPYHIEKKSNKSEHEKITLSFDGKISKIWILPGCVSVGKEYVYKASSRPKDIKIIANDKDAFLFTLEDKPCYQLILLPDDAASEEIEIISVYQGESYAIYILGTFSFGSSSNDLYFYGFQSNDTDFIKVKIK